VDSRVVLELLEHSRVVARERRDAVARLLGDVGEAVALQRSSETKEPRNDRKRSD
jgi:hypothetical protein